mgnify:CR=1 FL=1
MFFVNFSERHKDVKKEPAYTIIVAFSVLALLRNLLLLFSWFYSFVNSKPLITAWQSPVKLRSAKHLLSCTIFEIFFFFCGRQLIRILKKDSKILKKDSTTFTYFPQLTLPNWSEFYFNLVAKNWKDCENFIFLWKINQWRNLPNLGSPSSSVVDIDVLGGFKNSRVYSLKKPRKT